MFRGCRSLISVDLSNFSHSNFYYGQYMFYGCPNLIYVNLNSAHYCNSGNVNNFVSGSKNIAFCNGCNVIQPQFNNHGCPTNDCSTNWRNTQKKINYSPFILEPNESKEFKSNLRIYNNNEKTNQKPFLNYTNPYGQLFS
jgi:hypothetical protein